MAMIYWHLALAFARRWPHRTAGAGRFLPSVSGLGLRAETETSRTPPLFFFCFLCAYAYLASLLSVERTAARGRRGEGTFHRHRHRHSHRRQRSTHLKRKKKKKKKRHSRSSTSALKQHAPQSPVRSCVVSPKTKTQPHRSQPRVRIRIRKKSHQRPPETRSHATRGVLSVCLSASLSRSLSLSLVMCSFL